MGGFTSHGATVVATPPGPRDGGAAGQASNGGEVVQCGQRRTLD